MLATLALLSLMVVSSDADPAEPPPIAVYEDADGRVTLQEDRLVEFLLETRGLDALLNLMRLELAEAQAEHLGVTVTEADVQAEVDRTLTQAFGGQDGITPDDYPNLLQQLLTARQLSRAEFDVIIATNAHLRAVAEPAAAEAISDEVLREAFNVRYGERVRVRVIVADGLVEVINAREQIEQGATFEEVARRVNRDPVLASRGGEIPPFARTSDLPDTVKRVAFGMEVGEVSAPIEARGQHLILRLEERLAPEAVKFEDVADALREQLIGEQVEILIPGLRRGLNAILASGRITIANPTLARQLQARLDALRPTPIETPTTPTTPTTTPTTSPAAGDDTD
jgi:parvulin-like peptidyl-prolyl isomerase